MNGPHLERLRAVAATPKKRLVAVGGRRDLDDAPSALAEGVTARVHVYQLGQSAKPVFEVEVGDAGLRRDRPADHVVADDAEVDQDVPDAAALLLPVRTGDLELVLRDDTGVLQDLAELLRFRTAVAVHRMHP